MDYRYIIMFNTSFTKESCIEVVKKHNAKVRYLFELIPAVAIEIAPEEIPLLNKDPHIDKIVFDLRSGESKPSPFKFLDPDKKIRYLVPADYDYNADRVQRELEKDSDVHLTSNLANIDTGVDNQHPVLRGRVDKEYDLTGEGLIDLNGHGTIVASIALVSAQLRTGIISVKVANKKGVFWESDIMAGIEVVYREAVERETTISVNISLGIYHKKCVGDCPLCLLANAASNKLLIFAAAGNIPGLISCPAKAGAVISVGALDSSGKIANYSGTGKIHGPGTVKFKTV